jgi:hypothetical protein
MKRGAVRKDGSKLLTVWVPVEMAAAVDAAVEALDSDKSKFARKAIREKLAKLKIPALA